MNYKFVDFMDLYIYDEEVTINCSIDVSARLAYRYRVYEGNIPYNCEYYLGREVAA